MPAFVNEETCISCEACVSTCPVDAISMNGNNGTALVDAPTCIDCEACISACPVDALSMI